MEDGPVAQRISAPTESSVTTSVPAPMEFLPLPSISHLPLTSPCKQTNEGH